MDQTFKDRALLRIRLCALIACNIFQNKDFYLLLHYCEMITYLHLYNLQSQILTASSIAVHIVCFSS